MFIGIDFGTSNSAVSAGDGDSIFLVPLEHGETSMPTALFFNAEEQRTAYGRHAVREYTAGTEGRLMRSIKSILGSTLIEEKTMVGGRPTGFDEIIAIFLRHLREVAQSHLGCEIRQAVLGRPVHFVDEDKKRDNAAQATLKKAALAAGFREVAFQFEPIAAAFDYESGLSAEETVLVIDIGGGTSDFSVIRVGPALRAKRERKQDILASGGVHLGGTDFDRRLSLLTAMRALGLGSPGNGGKAVPAPIYFDLATWHKINFLYTMKEVHAANQLRTYYADTSYHDRLMAVLNRRLGHRVAESVEEAKIAVADGGRHTLDLGFVEPRLKAPVTQAKLIEAIESDVEKIVGAAVQTLAAAQVNADEPLTLYFTGGSTGLRILRDAFGKRFPRGKPVMGDKFGSVGRGLGVYAARLYGK